MIAHGKLEHLCTKTTYLTSLTFGYIPDFHFKTIITDKSGTPMGFPLSSFLAEAGMQDLQKRSVTNNTDIKTNGTDYT